MKPLPAVAGPCEENARDCTSFDEVATAIHALTESDYAKLMMIATAFCRSRRLPPSVIEPEELISEAVKRTLQLEKRWVRRVSILKHLDRAMENISGHLVHPSSKIVPFPNGLSPVECESDGQSSPADLVEQRESVQRCLKDVFGDDQQAQEVFLARVEGFSVTQTKSKFQLNDTQYESVTKRIRRKIVTFNSKDSS